MKKSEVSSSIDIPSRYLKQIESILKQIIPQREVWLYGSRVNDGSYVASDVDLVFFPDQENRDGTSIESQMKEMDLQLQLKAAFQESNIPLFVDILSWIVIPETFHKRILEQKYVIIQKTDS